MSVIDMIPYKQNYPSRKILDTSKKSYRLFRATAKFI